MTRAAHHELGVIWPTKPENWVCTATFHHPTEAVYTWSGPRRLWMCKLHKQVAQMPRVPTPATLSSHSLPASMASCEFSKISWQRKRRLGPGLQMVMHNMKAPPKSGQLKHRSPFLGHPWRTVVKENPPRWLTFEPWLFTLLGMRSGKMCNYVLIHGLWPMVWLEGQGLEKNMVEKLRTRKFVKEVCG